MMKKIVRKSALLMMVICLVVGLVGCNSKQAKDVIFTNDIHTNKNGDKCLVLGVKEPANANDIELEDYLESILEKNKQSKTLDEIWVLVYPEDVDSDKVKENTMKSICVCDGLILGKEREDELDFCIKIKNDKENKIYSWRAGESPIEVVFSNENGSIKY